MSDSKLAGQFFDAAIGLLHHRRDATGGTAAPRRWNASVLIHPWRRRRLVGSGHLTEEWT